MTHSVRLTASARLGRVAAGAAVRGVGLVARRVGAVDGGCGLGRVACGCGLLGGGALGRGDQVVAAAALLEHALGAAGRRLGQLAAGADRSAARCG